MLTLSEQQYFVWDTASQSTKWQGMLEIFFLGGMAPLAALMCALDAIISFCSVFWSSTSAQRRNDGCIARVLPEK